MTHNVFISNKTEDKPRMRALMEDLKIAVLRQAAQQLCAPFTKSDVNRLQAVRTSPEQIRCLTVAGQWRCGYDGEAVCALQSRRTETGEVCP